MLLREKGFVVIFEIKIVSIVWFEDESGKIEFLYAW